MPFLPPIGPLAAPMPGVPGIPRPGIPRPDFGALFDQAQDAAPGPSLPLAPSGVPSQAPLAPSKSLAPLGPDAISPPAHLVGPRADRPQGLGVEPLFQSIGNYLGNVNQLAQTSDAKQRDLAMGKNVELHDVMLAAEKSSVAIQLTMQIRNKLVESYQEVMRMQV